MASDWVEEAEREQVTARDCQAILCQKSLRKNESGYQEPPQEIVLGDKPTIQEGGKPFALLLEELVPDELLGLYQYHWH